MKCSICKTELVQGEGQKRYQTIGEHAWDPNAVSPLRNYWICPNPECPATNKECFWDEMGSCYGGYKLEYINKNPEAFGSFARKSHVEVYKHNEDKIILNLYFVKFNKVYAYEADEDGNVLNRKWKIEILIRRKGGYILYISGIRMLFYCIRKFKHSLGTKTWGPWSRKTLYEDITNKWDKRWWKKLYRLWIRVRHPKLRKQIIAEFSKPKEEKC
jgi:hypothetical protein